MYWIDAITLWGFEARMEDISERDMHALMPLLGELGAAASFGKAGTDAWRRTRVIGQKGC